MSEGPTVKERIVQAAVQLLRTGGARKLAQPQVAKEAGVPQGHLTYYFPKRSDLLAAVARNYLESAAAGLMELVATSEAPIDSAQLLAFASDTVKDIERTRMLIGLLVEADEEPGVRVQLRENAASMRTAIAITQNRAPDDPEVMLVQAALWGLAVLQLVHVGAEPVDTAALVKKLSEWISPKAKGRKSKGSKDSVFSAR